MDRKTIKKQIGSSLIKLNRCCVAQMHAVRYKGHVYIMIIKQSSFNIDSNSLRYNIRRISHNVVSTLTFRNTFLYLFTFLVCITSRNLLFIENISELEGLCVAK